MANNFSKKFFRDVAYSISLILFFSFVIFGAGCKVGLGESIDAMAPTLSFTNPGLSSVLKDDIVISGEWDDDKGVNQIYVTIKDTESSKVIVSDEPAQVVNDGTWTYTIFSKTSARAAETDTTVLSDGKYEVSIYAIDVGNHQSGIYSRTFEVDTQPPLVVLSKPNSVNIKDASTYGRKIQITGAVSDDHKVESLDIRVWKSKVNENGIVVPDDDKEITLPKSTFTNFDTSDMAVTIAQYWKNPPEDEECKALYDNYIAIYGSGNKEENPEFDTTQKFFIQISATDKSGNTSERVYAKSKLNNVLKQILADNGITNKTFEPNELKNILNGSYTGSLPADVLTEIENALYAKGKYEDVLANGYISDNLTWLAFTVNSKANPNYALDYKYSSGSWSEINKELPVSINLTAGLDGYEIHPDSLKVSLIPVDPITLNEIEDSKVHVIDVGLEKIYQDGNPLKTVDSQGNVELKTTTVTSAKYTFIPAELEELKAGYCYKIKVEGHDEEGLELYPLDDNDYGFKIQFTASVPQIKTQDFEDGDYLKAEDFYLENDKVLNFTVEDYDDMPMEFTASTYIASKRLVLSEINKMLEADPGLLVALDDFKKITLDSSSHYRIKDEKAYKITIPVVITPDALTSNFTVILRIDVVKDEVPVTKLFYFYADNAAPEMELSNAELKNWNGSDSIIITEQTPTLVLDTDKNSPTYGYYIYTINGTWKDAFGSGTKKVYWSIDSDDKATGTWNELSEDVAIQSNPGSDRPSSWTASFPLYHLEGIDRSINYYADDNVGNETEVRTYKNIVFDFGVPKIESAVLDEYYGKSEKPLEIIFNAEDTNQIADVVFEITKNGKPLTEEELKLIKVTKTPVTEEEIAKNAETGEVEWKAAGYDYRTEKVSKMSLKVEIPRDSTCDGLYKFTATATDIAGRQSAPLVRTTTIDCVAPKINDDLKVGNLNWSGTSYYKDLTLKMSGSFTESIGMDALYYYVQYPGRTGEVPADLTVLNEGKIVADGSVNFKQGATDFSFTVENYHDNTPTQANILYMQAVDKAGNKSSVTSYTVNIDTSAPELSVVMYRVEGTSLKYPSGTVYANGTKTIEVYGNYTDEQSGVDNLVFTLDGKEFIPDDVNYSTQEITTTDSCKEILEAHENERPVDTAEYNANTANLWYLHSKFAAAGTTKTIKSWRAIFTPTEEVNGILEIEGRNGTYTGEGNGGKTSIKSFTITMDKTAPSLKNIRLITDAQADKDAYSNANVYYINNKTNTNLTISGVSTDNTGVDTITLELQNSNGQNTGIVVENSGSAAVWKFEGINLSSVATDGAKAIIHATDIAGNTQSETLNIKFDTVAPLSIHEIDAKQKDLYFRIGEADNDDITKATAANYCDQNGNPLSWVESLDTDVGSKYNEGTYGNAKTIRIRGRFNDNESGSGVNMIYYKVFSHDPTDEEIADVIALKKGSTTGYFSPLAATQTRRVFYNVKAGEEDTIGGTLLCTKTGETVTPVVSKGYNKYFKNVELTYDSVLSGFEEGNNFVVIVAVDNVGNIGVSSVTIPTPDEFGNIVMTEYKKLTLNVDVVVPQITEITENDFTKNYIVNAQGKDADGNSLVLKGNVKDDRSGIRSFTLKVNETPVDATNIKFDDNKDSIELDDKNHTWAVSVPADVILLQNGSISVYAEATDNAGTGHTVSRKIASIQLDNTPPTVRATSTAGWIKNSIEGASAYVNDSNGIKRNAENKEEISYKVYASPYTEGATPLVSGTALVGTDGTSTIPSIDTSDGAIFVDGNSYLIRFEATDIVGNTAYAYTESYTIDRTQPVIDDANSSIDEVKTLNAVNADDKFFNGTTLAVAGKFTDAAGSLTTGSGVKTVYYELYNKKSSEITGQDVPVQKGSWSTIDGTYSSNINDFVSGDNTLRIWAEDALGNTSESAKIVYRIKVDNVQPIITSDFTGDDAIKYVNGNSPITVSGTVDDDVNEVKGSGVKSVVIYVGSSSELITATVDEQTKKWNAIIPKEKLVENGTTSVKAVATDKAGSNGNSSTLNVVTLNIDKKEPTIKFSTLKDTDSTVQVNGKIDIDGTATDENGIESVIALYFKESDTKPAKIAKDTPEDEVLSTEETVLPTGKNGLGWKKASYQELTGSTSWTFKEINTKIFDGTNEIEDGTIVYLTVAAKDKAGNIGYSDPVKIEVDQHTDRPIITFSNVTLLTDNQPISAENKVWIKRNQIYGTVSDDDGDVKTIEISFDYGEKGDDASWENIKEDSSGWVYDFGDGSQDGEKSIWFKVVDAKDTSFISCVGATAADRLHAPKLTNTKQQNQYGYREDKPGFNSTILYAKIDLIPPTIPEFYYTKKTTIEDLQTIITYEATDFETNGWKSFKTLSESFGGPNSKIYIYVKANDANGIDYIKKIKDEHDNEINTIDIDKLTLKLASYTATASDLKAYENDDKNLWALYELKTGKDTAGSGSKQQLSIKVFDKAGGSTQLSYNLNVDNEAPSLTLKTTDGTSVFGSISNSLEYTTTDGTNGSGVKKISYGVSTSKNVEPTSYKTVQEDDDETNINTNYKINWNWALTNNEGPADINQIYRDEYFIDWMLNHYLDELYPVEAGQPKTSEKEENKDLCIWLKAEDKFGNTATEKVTLKVIPQGDKPVVTVAYPKKEEGKEEKVGGTIRISGGTTIQTSSVSAVYIQIVPDYDSTKTEAENFANWKSSMETLMGDTNCGYTIEASGIEPIGDAIKAQGNVVSWNLPINVAKEFDKKDANGAYVNRNMAIRVYAVSTTNKVSDPVVVPFTLDSGAPVFGDKTPVRIVQFGTDSEGKEIETASRSYESGMWLKGQWYLVGSIEDESGIKKITVSEGEGTGKSVNYGTPDDITSTDKVESYTENEKYGNNSVTNYNMRIPIGKDSGSGAISYKINAVENSDDNKSTDYVININYDNSAPNFTTELNETGNEIYNSNGIYQIKGKLIEGGTESGFKRIAFYFTRTLTIQNDEDTSTDKTYIIDVMKKQGADGKQNRYDLADANTQLVKDDQDGLYWYEMDGCTASGLIITLPVTKANLKDYVRNGGLCKINNVIYRIKKIDESNSKATIELDSTPALKADVTSFKAYFAFAQVIDNTRRENGVTTFYDLEGQGSNTTGKITDDDGDGMVESYTESTGDWTVGINSKNILDGSVDIHFVAFDNAGNIVINPAIVGEVKNNNPRIAGIVFGTDRNGDGQITSDEEKSDYSGWYNITSSRKKAGVTVNGYDASDNRVTEFNIGSESESVLTIKGDTVFKPEIIGGNGGIGWTYEVQDQVKSTIEQLAYNHSSDDSIRTTVKDADGNDKALEVTLSVLKLLQDGVADGENQKFTFKFWDYTEGKIAGTNSHHADFNIYMDVAIQDDIKPTIEINPFHWTSADDNCVYYEEANGTKTAKGHIELEADWKNAPGYSSSATSGEYDGDPKVSGIIYMYGTANDNVLLKEIHLKFPGILNNLTKVAERNSSGVWEAATITGVEFDAAYANKKDNNNVAVNDTFSDTDGNTLNWRIKIDTSEISNTAALDVATQVMAIDRGKASLKETTVEGSTEKIYSVEYKDEDRNSSDTNTAEAKKQTGYTTTENGKVTVHRTPYYRMDVVPYITGVETSISSFLAKDYTRSAVGDYPIKLTGGTGETIKVSGFNLSPTNKAVDTNTVKSDVRLSKNETALSGTTKQGTGLKVTAGTGEADADKWLVTMSAAGNGYLTFFTNEIPSLNNVDSEADYNKEESLIHASLNNDRKFTLWDFTALRSKTSAPNAEGAIYPSMAMNGDIPQFAYVNNLKGYGIADFWDGSSEKEIYENWDLFTYTALALNSSGKRAALYDINVVQGGTGYQNDSGGILTNFFNDSTKVTYNSTDVFFQDNNVWLDGLYKKDVKAVLGRYEYPTIKLVGNDSISHVFYSVYDSLDDRIVFRYFTVGTGISNADRHAINKDSTLFINKNQLDQVDASGNWPDYTSFNPNAWSNTNMRFYRKGTRTATSKNPQAFATGKTVGLYTATAGVPVTTNNAGNVTAARGILVYYAGTEMYYTYAKNNANTTWSTPVVLDSNCEASYISMVVDGANHVHIAYQDNIAGDVKYIYIPKYSAPDTRKMVTVDSYLTVGDKLTLDVVGSTPYIGYKGLGNTAKVAWYVANNGVPAVTDNGDSAVTILTNGIDSDDKFTGSWNVEIIPNRIVDSDTNRFNVGVGRTNKRPVIGYSNNQSGSKGIEYLTRCADLAN